MIIRKALGATWVMGAIVILASVANASTLSDKLDPDLAQHPFIGKVYAHAFKAGVRIPAEFRGEWSSNKATCGADGDDLDTRIFVDAVTFSFGDETHVATNVRRRGPRSIALVYGPLIQNYHYMVPPPVLSLSSDGGVLQGWDASRKKPQGRWMRCPPIGKHGNGN